MQWKVGPNYKERPYKILGELVELREGPMIEEVFVALIWFLRYQIVQVNIAKGPS